MAYDSTLVVYTNVPLTYINVTPGMNLQTILQNINTAVNTMNPAPNYSGYNLGPYYGYSITQTDGTSHPTNTQNFAEGISKIVCKTESDLYTFINTTYPANQTTLSNAITALQIPGLTYSYTGGGGSISITSGMTRNQVLTATYTGVGNILALLNAPGSTWSTLSISTPTNINTAFNSLIAYLSNLTTSLSGYQTAIGTFDNSANCLAGTSTDSVGTTISSIITYICNTLPSFNASSITTSCLTTQTSLQNWVQQLAHAVDGLINSTVVGATNTSLLVTSTSCGGKTLAINPSSSLVTKVLNSSSDTTPGYLSSKVSAGSNITINTLNSGANEQIQISATLPTPNQVAVNSSDSFPGYLMNKITSYGGGGWGLSVSTSPSVDNSQLVLAVNVSDPYSFVQNMFKYISSDPNLLALFCTLVSECNGNQCYPPTALIVTISGSTFNLSWTYGANNTSQIVGYRQRGNVDFITNANITSANPQSSTTNSASVTGLNNNTVYQFQITSICTSSNSLSNIYESVIFSQQSITDGVNSGVISVNQAPMPTVNTITYTLYSGQSPVQTVYGTGINPVAKFAAVSSGNYTVKYSYTTLVNGINVTSSTYTSGTITV